MDWETDHHNSVLEIRRLHSFISGNTQMGTRHLQYIGFSPALYLQCTCNIPAVLLVPSSLLTAAACGRFAGALGVANVLAIAVDLTSACKPAIYGLLRLLASLLLVTSLPCCCPYNRWPPRCYYSGILLCWRLAVAVDHVLLFVSLLFAKLHLEQIQHW
jgi:hypothetical protein